MIAVRNLNWGWYDKVQNFFHCGVANSAGGVSVQYKLKNYGYKPVKKYSIYFKAINGVNEPAICTIKHTSIQGVSGYDMIDSYGNTNMLLAENLWYNHAIRNVFVDHIEVVYTDGTTETCIGNYVPNDEESRQEQKSNTIQGILAIIVLILIICFIFLKVKLII